MLGATEGAAVGESVGPGEGTAVDLLVGEKVGVDVERMLCDTGKTAKSWSPSIVLSIRCLGEAVRLKCKVMIQMYIHLHK